jgi:hypothetical protein
MLRLGSIMAEREGLFGTSLCLTLRVRCAHVNSLLTNLSPPLFGFKSLSNLFYGHKKTQSSMLRLGSIMAEREGFEPSIRY